MSKVTKCAACGKEKPVGEMKTCMHAQMHRYVCDSKCMNDFYNPPKKPSATDRVAALEAECERLRGEISDLHTTMMAAAVEIQEHWAAHCEDGYGPNNLMHRLENGIAAQYGYTAQTLVQLEAERDALRQQPTEGSGDE